MMWFPFIGNTYRSMQNELLIGLPVSMPFGIVYFGSNAFVNRISRREARFGEIFRPQAPSCGKFFCVQAAFRAWHGPRSDILSMHLALNCSDYIMNRWSWLGNGV